MSIDGARGVLFNIIGGNDLSMHEINTAAEAITAAADPDANIIFGATISPDLEGEIIITVVATGFDAAYYAKHNGAATAPAPAVSAASDMEFNPATITPPTAADDTPLSNIDLSLDTAHDDSFASDSPMPNIWTIDDDHHDDTAQSNPQPHDDGLQGNNFSGSHQLQDNQQAFTSSDSEEELERPSFLRRLRRRRGNDDTDNKDA